MNKPNNTFMDSDLEAIKNKQARLPEIQEDTDVDEDDELFDEELGNF